jgi:hypothetical protein
MKIRNLTVTLTYAAILGTVAFAQNKEQTFTGVVSDNMCGKQHMSKNKPAAQCTRECVSAGADYGLVVGDKVYALKGDRAQIDRFAGQKATITGEAKDETINVRSISATKQ